LDTEKILAKSLVNGSLGFDSPGIKDSYNMNIIKDEIIKSNNKVVSTIKNKPNFKVNVDGAGRLEIEERMGHTIKRTHGRTFV